MPFVIRNDEKDIQFKLDSVDFFEREYKPRGYRILDPQPIGGTLPERGTKKVADEEPPADPPTEETAKQKKEREKAEKEAAELAEAEAKAAAEAAAKAKDAA